MSASQYVVSIRGLKDPVCIEADRFDFFDDTVQFSKLGVIVSIVNGADVVARADVIVPTPDHGAYIGVDVNRATVDFLEPGEAMQMASTVMDQSLLPFWPVLAGSALGFIAGAGAVLSHVGAW